MRRELLVVVLGLFFEGKEEFVKFPRGIVFHVGNEKGMHEGDDIF